MMEQVLLSKKNPRWKMEKKYQGDILNLAICYTLQGTAKQKGREEDSGVL